MIARFKRLGHLLAESMRGTPRDYTRGSINEAILLLSIPMILEMVLASISSVTDIFYVRRLGPDATATIGLTESILIIVHTIALGIGIGATTIVSRRIGENDFEGAANTTVQVLLLGLLVSIMTTVIGICFAPSLLHLMGGSPQLVAYGVSYMQVVFGGAVVIFMLQLGNAILRGSGDGSIAMRALAIATTLNIALAPCLIFGWFAFPRLGVIGAALSSMVAQGAGAVYSLSHLFFQQTRISTHLRLWRPRAKLLADVLKYSTLATIQIFISAASWIGIIRIISIFGKEAIAGCTIGSGALFFAINPASGLGHAAATLVGQSLGAQNPDRAEKVVWATALYNLGFLALMAIVFMVFAPIIVGWFSTDRTVIGFAVSFLRTLAPSLLIYAFGMIFLEALNGAGDIVASIWINIVALWLFQIPSAWLFSHKLNMGPPGVFWAIMLALSLSSVMSVVTFRRGRWKTQHV
jgi:putative MATE family efflux protein